MSGRNFFGIMKPCRCDCSSAGCGFSKGWTQHKEGGSEQNRRPEPQHALREEDHSRGDEIGFFHGSSASSCEPQATNAELEARSSKLISKKAGRARSLGFRLGPV